MEELLFKTRKWWNGEWDLYRHEQLVGSIIIKNKWSRNLAEARIGQKHWEIGYKIWSNHFFVHDAAGSTIAETVSSSFWKSTMEIDFFGKRYILSSNWRGRYQATEQSGAVVATILPRWWKCSGVLSLRNPNNEAELLIGILLFYRMKIDEMNMSS